jgi:hypothetical protein
MTLKSYLWGMRISALLSLAALALVVRYIDPTKAGIAGLVLFYGSVFLFLSAIFVLFFTWLRKSDSSENAQITLALSFRQGILMSLMTIGLLLFAQFRILLWWDGLLLVAGTLLVELHFLTRRR